MSKDMNSDFLTFMIGVAIGTWWVEAGNAAKHPTVDRTAPKTEDELAQNVSTAPVETLA